MLPSSRQLSRKSRVARATVRASRLPPTPGRTDDAGALPKRMNLHKATGTIGGLTMVSRIAGFAREMLMARILGAGIYTDAFYVAFRLPNTFRRLFGEGAVSAGGVPPFNPPVPTGGGSGGQKVFAGK